MDEPRRVTTCVGIDVSKDRLDVHLRPSGEAFAVARDGKGLENLVERLAALDVSLIVLEATGGFETTVAAALAGAGLPLAVVNPRQIRDFARALGRLAKTDAIDAAVIASFAEKIRPEAERATAAANIVSSFKNIFSSSWGYRLEYILGHSLRLLLDTRDQTLLGLPRLLVDDTYRDWLVRRCQDPVVRAFWQTEYAAYDSRFRNEAIAPIQNKVGAFLANPFIRSILCQNSSTLDIAKVMNTGKVLIVNLSKGNLGTEPAHLLGALLITACSQAAEARRHMPEHERRDFTLYVDEFQNFATDSFASILSEARKWRLSLVAANQQIAQLPEALQHAVFGNAGTLVAFRVGAHDARRLVGELGTSNPATLTQTNNHRAWIKLMRNGAPLEPHLIRTLAPPPPGTRLEKVIAFAHACHMMPRKPVEERIAASFPKAPAKRPRHRGKRDPDKG